MLVLYNIESVQTLIGGVWSSGYAFQIRYLIWLVYWFTCVPSIQIQDMVDNHRTSRWIIKEQSNLLILIFWDKDHILVRLQSPFDYRVSNWKLPITLVLCVYCGPWNFSFFQLGGCWIYLTKIEVIFLFTISIYEIIFLNSLMLRK